jgi:hypothetical protein
MRDEGVAPAATWMSKWFYNTSTGTTARVAHYGSLFEGVKVRLDLGQISQSGHKDLRGLGCQSVTPYVHGMRCCIGCMMFKLGLNLPKRACLKSAAV